MIEVIQVMLIAAAAGILVLALLAWARPVYPDGHPGPARERNTDG
jgi:hypothetical protein